VEAASDLERNASESSSRSLPTECRLCSSIHLSKMREQDRHFFDSPKKHFHHSIAVKSPHRSRSQRSSSFRKRSIASLCRLSASVFVPCPCSILCSAEVCHHWYRQLHSSSDRVPRSLSRRLPIHSLPRQLLCHLSARTLSIGRCVSVGEH